MARITKKLFKDAAADSGGVQSIVAQRLEVSRQSVSVYIKKHEDMKAVLELERERIIDKAESELFKAADRGEKWAIDKILRTIGKNRGYIEKQELEITEKLSSLTKEEREEEIKRLLGK